MNATRSETFTLFLQASFVFSYRCMRSFRVCGGYWIVRKDSRYYPSAEHIRRLQPAHYTFSLALCLFTFQGMLRDCLRSGESIKWGDVEFVLVMDNAASQTALKHTVGEYAVRIWKREWKMVEIGSLTRNFLPSVRKGWRWSNWNVSYMDGYKVRTIWSILRAIPSMNRWCMRLQRD